MAKMDILASPRRSVRATVAASPAWKQGMKAAVRDPAELLRLLKLPDQLLPAAQKAARQFGLFVPLPFLSRMKSGDLTDPLLRQVLPIFEELADVPDFSADPVGDLAAQVSPGMLHKYAGRVLLVTTGACAVHCRYCFRRHFPYHDGPRSPDDWAPALAQIAADESIEEVLLSGGDPLTLADETLAELATRLADIPHVQRLRVHTRLPIMLPNRVNDDLLAWLAGTRLTPVMVIHANHAAEIDDEVAASLARMSERSVMLLNQAVLLRGVNDSLTALAELSRRLLEVRVMPYYLHQLDRVAGAAHFEVPVEQGLRLIEELRATLPGYAVPRYVCEIAGEANKRVIA